MEQTYRSQILDHLGLVAGMLDELGIGEVVDKATQQNPEGSGWIPGSWM